jgi:hypothetical protein
VPLFGPVVLDSPAKFLKKALYAFNGMEGTDENETFVDEARSSHVPLPWLSSLTQVKAALSGQKLLVICDAGGNYKGKIGNSEGKSSRCARLLEKRFDLRMLTLRARSLVAIYKLLDSGAFGDILHVSGGTRGWGSAGFEFAGTEPDAWKIRAGAMPPSS